jgi:hypothetical protein
MADLSRLKSPSTWVLALLEEVDEEDDKPLPEFLQINLIDRILAEFTSKYPIRKLLEKVKTYMGGWTTHYTFNQSTYTATIDVFRSGDLLSPPNHQLTIRLSHDGFRYHKPGTEEYTDIIRDHSGIPGYHVMKVEYLKDMQTLSNIQRDCDASSLQFLYNYRRKRIDIEFRKGDGICPLKITFEHGRQVSNEQYYVDLYGTYFK